MTTVSDSVVGDPALLRAAMVGRLREDAIVSQAVEAAFATVPRHLFAPDAALEESYAPHGTVIVKRGRDGATLSVMSAPHLQAVMLEQAGIEQGMRVLEIGSGGYNAALIQELVGVAGAVTTVDIDQDVVERARACLDSAGYERVNVVLADGDGGAPMGAPYDRIVVTFGAWDIASAWIEQLVAGGRLVVPLRLGGTTRSIAFDRVGQRLVGQSYRLARFVPVQGVGAFDERRVVVRDGVAMQSDDAGVLLDAAALNDALGSEPLVRWSGVAQELPDELELFLTFSLPRPARLHASEAVVDSGLIASSALLGVPALVGVDGSFAYRTRRENSELASGFESGVIAHGPHADALANLYLELLRRWARDHRRRGAARFEYLPLDALATTPPGTVVTKRHGLLAAAWH